MVFDKIFMSSADNFSWHHLLCHSLVRSEQEAAMCSNVKNSKPFTCWNNGHASCKIYLV